MGVCLSCLGLSKESESDPSETSRLLNSGPSQPEYGSSNGPTSARDLAGSKHDPEQERREREVLNAIWKSTSDKLIDISSTTTLATEHQPAASTTEINFARLFHDTFPRRQPHPASRPKQDSTTSADAGAADAQQQRSPARKQSPPKPADEQSWLREIIMRDPGDKSWDCNTVHKIGKPLIIEFDEGGGRRDDSGAVKALKEAKDKIKS